MLVLLANGFLFLFQVTSKKTSGNDPSFVHVSCNDSGDTDAIIPVTATRYSIDALKLPTLRPWHAWYDDGQVNKVKITIFFSKLSVLLLLLLSLFSFKYHSSYHTLLS
jgi:hypothetical protein